MQNSLYRPGKIEDFYELFGDEIVGFGSTCVVIKAISKANGENYAVKVIDSSEIGENDIQKELQVLSEIVHPNIVKVIEFYVQDGHYLIIFEWMSGGEVRLIFIILYSLF